MKKFIAGYRVFLACIFAFSANCSQAALHDRGGGLLYDDVLDVTWLQDANYAQTIGFDTDGRMNWVQATGWVSGLSYFDSVRNVYWDDWRLPSVSPVNKEFNYVWDWTGNTDEGYNITSENSELSYMYYVNLGLNGWYLPNGVKQTSPFGVLNTTSAVWTGQADVGLAKNVQSYIYWSNTLGSDYINKDAWIYVFAEGNQRDGFPHPGNAYVWAVRDGDVLALPEMPGYLSFLFGFGVLALLARKRNEQSFRN